MAKSPAYPMYAQDFDMDTATWDNYELGMYIRILNYIWINGSIKSDHESLAKVCRCSVKKFDHNCKNLFTKLIQNGEGYLQNNRMEEERVKQEFFKESQRLKGIKSGEKRKKKTNRGSTGVKPKHEPKVNLSSSSSFSFSFSIKNLLPEDIKEIVKKDSWNGFVEMRNKTKKPLTERAIELIGIELSKLMKKGNEPNAVLDQSTVSNYQDVYALKNKGGNNAGYKTGTSRDSQEARSKSSGFGDGNPYPVDLEVTG
jgi:uncharacterized protein YdaU (DUF1376 family)